jgi:Flp pilus assembly pilin Flp
VFSNISRLIRKGEEARESGQALVEYTLLLMFIVLVAVTALESIGQSVVEPLSDVATGIGGA